MAIITVDRLLELVPSLESLTEEQLTLAINTAIFAVQSPEGANRRLEITNYQEIKKLRLVAKQISLSYFPIIEIDKLYIRGETYTHFQRSLNTLDWVELDSQFYRLEPNGTITINVATPVRNYLYHKPIEIKVDYSAGYDFEETTDENVVQIQSLIAQCINFQTSQRATNIKSISVDGEFSTSYNNEDLSMFGMPKSYLSAFKVYAPRKNNG